MNDLPIQYPPPPSTPEISLSVDERASAVRARQVVESLLPDEQERAVYLRILARYIEHASDFNPASWSITLFGNVVRLNVGRVVALSLYQGGVYWYCDPAAIVEEDRPILELVSPIASMGDAPVWNNVGLIWTPSSILADAEPIIMRLGLAYVERRAKESKRGTYHSFHSPGVVAYLREAADPEIREPDYGLSTVGSNAVRDRIASILALKRPTTASYALLGQPHMKLTEALSDLASKVAALEPMVKRPLLKSDKLYGAESVSAPWVRIHDDRVASFLTRGVFVLLLFRADNSGVYVLLTQGNDMDPLRYTPKGVGRYQKTTPESRSQLAAQLRDRYSSLTENGFELDNHIDLRSNVTDHRARLVEPVIAHKLYAADALPTDAELSTDLEAVLTAYDDYIASVASDARNTWLFQANPEQFDLAAELRDAVVGAVDEWKVSRYREDMHQGDRVILWMSGINAGIYAIGELTDVPHVRSEVHNDEEIDREPYLASPWIVPFKYTRILESSLAREELLATPALQNMQVLRSPQGTNFKVTDGEWAVIEQLLGATATAPAIEALGRFMNFSALSYAPEQLATFFTALQTKGFVILSGISGTGKTKLVQAFAEILPQPELEDSDVLEKRLVGNDTAPSDAIFVQFQKIMVSHGHINLKTSLMQRLRLTAANVGMTLQVYLDDQSTEGRIDRHPNQGDPNLHLTINAPLKKWLTGPVPPRGIWLVPAFDHAGKLTLIHMSKALTSGAESAVQPTLERPATNSLFLSVRPDWRDSKSLLGYVNPLTGVYQATDFLRFVQRAARDFSANGPQATPWFVVLDEMNLAHVEYYFADLLSVLESGRDEAGWTREKLRLSAGDASDSDAPADLALPPNLYIVGTVNIDETTHAFSPKVLDRAFSIELTDVDFSDYPPNVATEAAALSDAERQAMLTAFTRAGRFARIDKAEIAAYVGAHPAVRDQLQALNAALTPYNMHFGYRVFDEIVSFLAAADENGLFDDLGAEAAFDAAVLMKVLPKFHGSRRKLDAPLRAVLGWCGGAWPATPDAALPRFPRTAARVQRMLRDLEIDGFTAFG